MIKKYFVLKKIAPLFFLLFSFTAFSQSQTFNNPANNGMPVNTFTVPAGVTHVNVEAWGGGGKGASGTPYIGTPGGSGAGGGAYAKKNTVTVVSGISYSVKVGAGSIDNTLPGGDSYFINNTTILAKGGNSVLLNTDNGGLGGAGTLSIGDVVFSGGNGGNGIYGSGYSGKDYGGGGGSSAGTGTIGNYTSAVANNFGATSPIGGGNGGDGGNYYTLGNGSNGNIPGGGGGGALWPSYNGTVYYGGNGANGQVKIRWTCPTYSLTSTVIAAPVCSGGRATVTLNGSAANLPVGTYTVTYVQTGQNPRSSDTVQMTLVTAGTGSFVTKEDLPYTGTTTITITKLESGSCSSVISTNNTASVTVTNSSGAAGTITGTPIVCKGQNTIAYSVPAITNATSYTWAYSGTGATISGTTNNISINFAVNATSGNLTVRGANACGNGTVSANYAITINSLPNAPTVGTITQPTCSTATGSVVLSGLPSGNWTINPGAIAGSTASKTISGLSAGTYNYTVTNAVGCTSVVSANVLINAEPATPTAPTLGTITQPTCAVGTGSVVLNGLPEYWKLTRSPGNVTTTGKGTSTIISGLAPGTYTYTVIGTGLKGEYFNSTSPITNANNPTFPTTSPTLTRTDATVVFDWGNGNPGAPIGNDYFFVRWSGQIQPLYSETYTFTTKSDDGVRLWVNGSLIIDNWTIHPETYNTGIINLVAGVKYDIVLEFYEHEGQAVSQLYWNSTSQALQIIPQSQLYPAAVCSSPASANVVIDAQPATPVQPTLSAVTQPTCATATGSFTITNYNASYTYAINPATGVTRTGNTITAPSGNYTVTATLASCTSIPSASIAVNVQPVTPIQPTLSAVTQPTCATATGSFTITNYNASYTYAINPATGVTRTGNTITAPSGNYTVTATLASCTSIPSASIAVNAQPVTPIQPILSAVTQPTCATPTGSVVLSGLPAGNWTINPGAIAGTGTSKTISGLAAGAYTYTVTNTAGCTSTASENVVINSEPSNNIWNGSTYDENWNNSSNWCIGVPIESNLATLNVVIPKGIVMPDGSPNYPIISAGDAPGYVKTILFEENTTLNVRKNSLRVTDYLELDGIIYLEEESQLLQDPGSILDQDSGGYIELNQQGTANSYNYNYWGSSVGPISDPKTKTTRGTGVASVNAPFTVKGIINDGRSVSSPSIVYGTSPYAADAIPGDQLIISSYWLYTFYGSDNNYWSWKQINKNTSILAGEGYTMKGSSGKVPITNLQNYVFRGKPNNGKINLELINSDGTERDRLIGNPYPSALDANEFIKDHLNKTETIKGTTGSNVVNVFNGALYFWDHFGYVNSHNLGAYVGGYATYTLMGGAQAILNDDRINKTSKLESSKVPERYIPVGQGFFVITALDETLVGKISSTVNGGTITFKNSQRYLNLKREGSTGLANTGSVFMKNSNAKNAQATGIEKTAGTDEEVDLRPKIRLLFHSPKGYNRQLLIGSDENTTNNFDIGYDGLIADTGSEDMFWIIQDAKFVIQGVPIFNTDQEFPLGLKIAKAGLATIKIDALENMDENLSAHIKDKLTGEIHNISRKDFEINLDPGTYLDRFALIFKMQKLVAEDEVAEVLIPAIAQPIIEGIHVFMNNTLGELQIKNNSTEEITSVALINAVGQIVKTWNSNFNIRTISLPVNNATGVYLVQINTKKGVTNKKIVVN